MREPPSISHDVLAACLQEQYAIRPAEIVFLPLGLDTRAAIFRVSDTNGMVHLMKVWVSAPYEACYLVPRYLRDCGISAVVAPLRTYDGALWAQMDEWRVAVYPFIEGVTGWNPDMTDAEWQATGVAVSQVHHSPLPAEGIPSLRWEVFDPTRYHQQIEAIEGRLTHRDEGSQAEQVLRAGWEQHQAIIHEGMTTMQRMAEALHARQLPHVICHADLHQGNIIRTPEGEVGIIDWDDVMLAPKERDFLFTGDPPFAADDPVSPFFQGYGPAEIDWQALAYYRWERVITDVIECGQIVLFREGMGDTTKLGEVRLFHHLFAPSSSVDVARAAEVRVP